MNQQPNQPTNTVKRRRGRPRKDETQAQAQARALAQAQALNRPPISPMAVPLRTYQQGPGFGAPKPITAQAAPSSKGKGKAHVTEIDDEDQDDEDDHNKDDPLVGQVVTGVLQCAIDTGYLLKVRVGTSDVFMSGVVFKEGSVAPVTPENDIAPNAKMYRRRDFPIPEQAAPPGGGAGGGCGGGGGSGGSSSLPTEMDQDQQQNVTPAVETVQQECQTAVLVPEGYSEQQQEEPSMVNVDQQQVEPSKVNVDQQQEEASMVNVDQKQEEASFVNVDQPQEDASLVNGDQQQEEASLVNVDQKQETEASKEPSVAGGAGLSEAGGEKRSEEVEVGVRWLQISSSSPKAARRDDLLLESSQPLAKVQKTTDQTTDNITTDNVGSVDAPESAEATSVLLEEALVIPAAEAEFVTDSKKVAVVVETEDDLPDIGGSEGFQISMENTDTDDPEAFVHEEEPTNEVLSPMETDHSGGEAGDS